MKLLLSITLQLLILNICSAQKSMEGKLMNRTAYYLGMESCDEARSNADEIVKRLDQNNLDSAYYILMGDGPYERKEEVFDSIMWDRYKFRVIRPGWQPILKCYMDRLDSLMSEKLNTPFKPLILEEADKLSQN